MSEKIEDIDCKSKCSKLIEIIEQRIQKYKGNCVGKYYGNDILKGLLILAQELYQEIYTEIEKELNSENKAILKENLTNLDCKITELKAAIKSNIGEEQSANIDLGSR